MRRYEFFQHMTSGEVWAVKLDRWENVRGSCGPLHRAEIDPDKMDDYEYTADDNDWFAEHDDEFRILSRDEALQRANREEE